ncbi:MAG: S1C family serine protease [Candidatus Omnitrophota bacterium]|nr:S1C family serine protease [Candidatus Omnitrophota bacterium]
MESQFDLKNAVLITTLAGLITLLMPSAPSRASVIADILTASKAVVEVNAAGGGFVRNDSGGVRAVKFERKGGGIIIDAAGIVVTNAHIVSQAGRVTVTLQDKTTVHAEIVHIAGGQDLAFLKIEPPYPLTAFVFADSDSVELSHRVYAIGSSELLKNTISEGTVSGLGQDRQAASSDGYKVKLLRVSFEVYQGDSGSPILSRAAELLGITTAAERSGNHETFAIPSNIIQRQYEGYLESVV